MSDFSNCDDILAALGALDNPNDCFSTPAPPDIIPGISTLGDAEKIDVDFVDLWDHPVVASGRNDTVDTVSTSPAEKSVSNGQYDPRLVVDQEDIPPVTVTNMVCQSHVNCQLDLDDCGRRLANTQWAPLKFPALFVALKDPAVTLLVFGNGKVLITGSKSRRPAEVAMQKITSALVKLGYENARPGELQIHNLVANIKMPFAIELSKLEADPQHRPFCKSESEKFGCVNYTLKTIQPPITVRIFGSGAVTFQSARSEESLHQALYWMVPLFYQYRRLQNQPVDPQSLMNQLDHLEPLTKTV